MEYLRALNGELDLVLERVVPVPPEHLYRGWTEPELLMKWFVPEPFSVTKCEVDPVPGGAFILTIRDPEGRESSEPGCYLQLIPNRLVVFTDALGPGFRPTGSSFFTGIVSFEQVDQGTKYTARAIHASRERRDQHAEMGFEPGWAQTLAQLVELYEGD